MLAKVSLSTWSRQYKELSHDAWLEIAEVFGLEGEKPDHFVDVIAELDLAAVVCTRHGLTLEVASIPGTYALHGRAGGAALRQQLEKLRDWQGPAAAIKAAAGESFIVQVSVPDIGLLEIDEVEVMQDACTDDLRRMLDDGWRIIAVCPPNGQRRPDYVMGRSPRRRLALAPPPDAR